MITMRRSGDSAAMTAPNMLLQRATVHPLHQIRARQVAVTSTEARDTKCCKTRSGTPTLRNARRPQVKSIGQGAWTFAPLKETAWHRLRDCRLQARSPLRGFLGPKAFKREAESARSCLGLPRLRRRTAEGEEEPPDAHLSGSKLNFALQLADMSQGSCNLALHLMESHSHPLRADRKPLAQKGPWHVQHHFHG